MRAVVQRVRSASVRVDGESVGSIENGLLVFIGIGQDDVDRDVSYIADKLSALRLFDDVNGKINWSVSDVGGSLLVVSQFTLFGDCRRGRRPSYAAAASPETARQLYENVIDRLRRHGCSVQTGKFQAHMDVECVNDGPVTVLLDSNRAF